MGLPATPFDVVNSLAFPPPQRVGAMTNNKAEGEPMHAPFLRMFWKEYRSLRMLWVGVVLGALCLYGILVLRNQLGDGIRSSNVLDMVFICWTSALWLPAVYLLGCIVAAFAGEREERTADWLVNLAVPLRPLLAAKLLWPIASAVVMQVVLAGGAFITEESFHRSLLTNDLPEDVTAMLNFPQNASFILLEALAWGWLWSLLSSKPLPAAIGAAICLVGIHLVIGSLLLPKSSDWLFGAWGVWRLAVVLMLLAVDLLLARRWLAGQPFDPASFEGKQPTQVRRVAEIGVEPAAGWRREWRRFAWLEWQSIRQYLRYALAAVALAVVPIAVWQTPNSMASLDVLVSLLPLLTGVWAWQGEQSRQQFRCLANRGISPLGLWINKLGMWLGVLSAVFVIALSAVTGTLVLLDHPGVSVEPLTRALMRAPLWTTVWFFYGLSVVLFLTAFVVAMCFRKALFAVAVTFPLQLILLFWMSRCIELVPLWVGCVPVVAWLMFCSLRQLPRWFLEQTGWRMAAKIAAEWLIFPAAYAVMVIVYWVYAVPAVNVEAKMQEALRTAMAAQPHPAEIDLQWHEANIAGNRLSNLISQRWIDLDEIRQDRESSRALWQEIEPQLVAFRELLLKPTMITRKTYFKVQLRSIPELLLILAEREQQAGRLDDALRSLRAIVRLEGVNQTTESYQHHNDWPTVGQAMMRWTDFPETTPDMIRQALHEFEHHELRWYVTSPITLDREYRNTYANLGDLRQRAGELGWYGVVTWPAALRERRLAECRFSNQLRFLQTSGFANRRFGAFTPGTFAGDHDAAWAYREISEGSQLRTGNYPYGVPVGLSARFVNQLWARETIVRGTFAVMAVRAYEKVHGRLPGSLRDVIPKFASESLLTDPWSGEAFRFEPEGVDGELMDNGMVQKLAARTPFVWSVGPDRVALVKTVVSVAAGGRGENEFSDADRPSAGMTLGDGELGGLAFSQRITKDEDTARAMAFEEQPRQESSRYRLESTESFLGQHFRFNRFVFPVEKSKPAPQVEADRVDEPADALPGQPVPQIDPFQ